MADAADNKIWFKTDL